MLLLQRDKQKKNEAVMEYQKLLNIIPKDSEDFSFALSATPDELENLYVKYDVNTQNNT